MEKRWVALALACLITGCGDWKQDPASLTARGAQAPGMGCTACHNYPLQDSNHVYHLFEAGGRKQDNGPITCLDCHRNSLQSKELVLNDSIFVDPDPATEFPGSYSSLDWPVGVPPDSFALLIRTWTLDTVWVLRQNRPIPQAGRPLSASGLVEYMTGLAHMNGSVDIVFDAKYSDTARFGGRYAEYHPRQETCSAVSCHPTDGPYRFAAPSKGLDHLE